MVILHGSLAGRPVAQAAVCLAGVGLASPALAGLPCLNPAIGTPAQASRESSTRPMISWRAVAGVSSYRLQLVSREPEGRTLATIDTLVNDTRFVPPQALAMASRGSACASRASARRGATGAIACPRAPLPDRRALCLCGQWSDP
jgi:hypothetical protein